jgi:hypothetical protein
MRLKVNSSAPLISRISPHCHARPDNIIIAAIMFKLTAAFALLLCVGGFSLAAASTQFAIVDAVNEKVPKNEQFEHLGWYLSKTLRLHNEYRRFYPDGKLLRRQRVLWTIMLVCLVLAASLIFQSRG